MPGCSECTHNKSQLRQDPITRQHLPGIDVTCTQGNTETNAAWWERNGDKPRSEISEDLPCFEPTRTAVALDAVLDRVDRLHALLDKKATPA